MDISRLNSALDILRSVWLEGEELIKKIAPENENDFLHEYYRWNTKTEIYFKNLFYRQNFYNEFKELTVLDYGYNGNSSEIRLLPSLSNKLGFIESNGRLLKDGYIRDEAVGIDTTSSKNAFVAMWFTENTDDTYKLGILPAIENNNFDSVRIDKIHHNDKIDEKILEKIRDSRFLIADYTGHRGGVYFEAGYAKGLGLQVIPICKEDDVDGMHFDIKMYNTIIYKKIEELRDRLQERIKETIGIYRQLEKTANDQYEEIPF